MTELVRREDNAGLATLVLNRPDKLNSLTIGLFKELQAHLVAIKTATDSVGCVIVRGAGKCFSAGHDLNDISAGEKPPRLNFQGHVIEQLACLPQPVIVAVHGHCYTGALELALAGDIILASEGAKFADTHAKWAMAPHWGLSQRLPRRIGNAKALEMMFTCRTYSGAEAAQMGLANQCLPEDGFFESVDHFAREVLRNSWFSHEVNKRLLMATEGMTLEAGLAYEVRNVEGHGPDMQARITAFSKRK